MKNDKILNNIIDALSMHDDSAAVAVLEEIGTNSSDDEVRRLTAGALIKRNTPDSLSVVISKEGKGINDMNTGVAMSAINDLLALKNKSEAIKVLAETEEASSDECVQETARSVKSLMAFAQ